MMGMKRSGYMEYLRASEVRCRQVCCFPDGQPRPIISLVSKCHMLRVFPDIHQERQP